MEALEAPLLLALQPDQVQLFKPSEGLAPDMLALRLMKACKDRTHQEGEVKKVVMAARSTAVVSTVVEDCLPKAQLPEVAYQIKV